MFSTIFILGIGITMRNVKVAANS